MEQANAALLLLAASMFFALVIERVLEILKAVYDYIESRKDLRWFWDRRARDIRKRLLSRIESTEGGSLQSNAIKHLASRYLCDDYPGYEGALVISANRIRAFTIKSVAKVLGVLAGIYISYRAEIDVFSIIETYTEYTKTADDAFPGNLLQANMPPSLGYLISGIVMGLGSGPMHKFIVALERAHTKRQSTDAA